MKFFVELAASTALFSLMFVAVIAVTYFIADGQKQTKEVSFKRAHRVM